MIYYVLAFVGGACVGYVALFLSAWIMLQIKKKKKLQKDITKMFNNNGKEIK